MQALPTLEGLPLVRHLTAADRQTMLAAGSTRRLARGEVLFHEGDPAAAIFAVVSGKLKLVRTSPAGREMLLHLVRPGQSFAEAALYGDGTYPATAEAVEASVVWQLTRARLEEMVTASPRLALALVASISQWTRTLVHQLELMTQRRVEERLAIYLLGRAGGRELVAGDVIHLAEPRNLIAAQCGTAPEVLSRTFRRLEDEGVLRASGHEIEVVDATALRALAEWLDDER